jgi:DNA polymerase-3 subunit alpha
LVQVADLATRPAGVPVKLIAMITGVRRITTKTNRTMAILELEDLTGTIELVAFPDCYDRYTELWQVDAIVQVVARPERRGETLQLVCDSITTEIEDAAPVSRPARTIHVRLPASPDVWADINLMHQIDATLRRHEGELPVLVHVPRGNGRETVLRCRTRLAEWSPLFAAELSEIVGAGRVEVHEPFAAPLAS